MSRQVASYLMGVEYHCRKFAAEIAEVLREHLLRESWLSAKTDAGRAALRVRAVRDVRSLIEADTMETEAIVTAIKGLAQLWVVLRAQDADKR